MMPLSRVCVSIVRRYARTLVLKNDVFVIFHLHSEYLAVAHIWFREGIRFANEMKITVALSCAFTTLAHTVRMLFVCISSCHRRGGIPTELVACNSGSMTEDRFQ